MTNKIIHIQTQLQTIFGELDDNGNVVRQIPINATIPIISEQVFIEAARKLAEQRKSLELKSE